jgi:non-specific serine/threonine protein kinase/serine/threonine-protein kinase
VATVQAERWRRLKELFAAALDRDPAERSAFVAAACAGDEELGRELRELLRAAAVDDDFIEQPAAERLQWARDLDERAWLDRRVGPYRIVGVAGHGGLSHVFRAVRADGDYEQQVAIKLLRPGFGGEALLRRFRAERRLLAALAHPNIALFLDGGATEDGTPYLVMEFVEGRPIDDYCDANALGLEARLDLFRVLCGAVQYVHQHLMVHGDVKGGNVLVTADGVVKLLDFGIAKLLTPDASGAGATRPATLLMLTPDYASPEQLRGEPITTASDVYSLGALLYRLLAGTTPYGTDHAPPAVLAEKMASGAPEPPSVAAERTGGAYAALARALRGDVDTIVLKALKPDARERYPSAEALADDLQRWLRGFPVQARPDSLGYRLRTWIRRHRAAAAGLALAVVSLLAGIAATSWQAHVAQRERARAERHFQALRELSSTLVLDVYQAVNKIPGTTGARKLLVDKTLKYLQALEHDASDSVEVRRDLGMAYERLADIQGAYTDANLGDIESALANYRRSLAIRAKLAQDHPDPVHEADLLRAHAVLVEALLGRGDVAGARALAPELRRLADRVRGQPAPDRTARRYVGSAYMTLGWLETSSGDAEGGVATLLLGQEVYRGIAADFPQDRVAKRDVALMTGRLGEAYKNALGDYARSLDAYRAALAPFAALLAGDPENRELQQMVSFTRASIADLHNVLGQPRVALRELDRLIPVFRRERAVDPANQTAPLALAAVLNMAGDSHLLLGRLAEARSAFAEAASLVGPKLPADVPDVALIAGAAQAGLAAAERGLAARGGAEAAARRERAEAAAREARRLLEPLVTSPGHSRDARRALARLAAV